MNYDVDFFIRKFEAIPDELWTTGVFEFTLGDKVLHCANGFCGVTNVTCDVKRATKEAVELANLLSKLPVDYKKKYGDILFDVTAMINDGRIDKYQQLYPKQRILAALYDVKKMQQPKPIIKEVIKYVSVPNEIKEVAADYCVN